MELVKIKYENSYTWKGLTLGKLLAIQATLEEAEETRKLSIVESDVKTFLDYQKLEQ